jgi:hypothetical protein
MSVHIPILWISACLPVHLCLSVYLSICLSACLPASSSVSVLFTASLLLFFSPFLSLSFYCMCVLSHAWLSFHFVDSKSVCLRRLLMPSPVHRCCGNLHTSSSTAPLVSKAAGTSTTLSVVALLGGKSTGKAGSSPRNTHKVGRTWMPSSDTGQYHLRPTVTYASHSTEQKKASSITRHIVHDTRHDTHRHTTRHKTQDTLHTHLQTTIYRRACRREDGAEAINAAI